MQTMMCKRFGDEWVMGCGEREAREGAGTGEKGKDQWRGSGRTIRGEGRTEEWEG